MRSLVTLLLLAGALCAAGDEPPAGEPMPQPPHLPATAPENWKASRFRFGEPVIVYDDWNASRKMVAKLPAGSHVQGIGKLHVIHQPDKVTILSRRPALNLEPGDTILRYTYWGEGFADFWIKGRWYKELDGSFITEIDGNGCSRHCAGRVSQNGRKETWLHVRLEDGHEGWVRGPY